MPRACVISYWTEHDGRASSFRVENFQTQAILVDIIPDPGISIDFQQFRHRPRKQPNAAKDVALGDDVIFASLLDRGFGVSCSSDSFCQRGQDLVLEETWT